MKARYDTSVWERLVDEKSAARERERVRVLETAPAVIRNYLTGKCSAAYLTGSILIEGRFGAGSDLDVAVEGLLMEGYFRAIVDLERLLDRDVDIIELESCPFREKIIAGGIRII